MRRGRPSAVEAEALAGRILDASWDVLLTEGFENFTFDRVARQARIGKATIYSRFTGKSDLLYALFERRNAMRHAEIEAYAADLPFAEAWCRRAVRILEILFSPEGRLVDRLIDWLDDEPDSGRRVRGMAYGQALASITAKFSEASERGEVVLADPCEAARFWLEGLLGHTRLAETEGTPTTEDNEAWAKRFSDFFFAGIAPRPQLQPQSQSPSQSQAKPR